MKSASVVCRLLHRSKCRYELKETPDERALTIRARDLASTYVLATATGVLRSYSIAKRAAFKNDNYSIQYQELYTAAGLKIGITPRIQLD